jgi:hypothetical protein
MIRSRFEVELIDESPKFRIIDSAWLYYFRPLPPNWKTTISSTYTG